MRQSSKTYVELLNFISEYGEYPRTHRLLHIDAQTMGIHYTLHRPTYINDLNAAVEGTGFAEWPEQLRAAAILKAPWLRRSMSNWTNVLLSIRMAVIAGGDVALLCAWLVSLAELLLPLGLALAAGAMLLIGFCLMIVMDTALD